MKLLSISGDSASLLGINAGLGLIQFAHYCEKRDGEGYRVGRLHIIDFGPHRRTKTIFQSRYSMEPIKSDIQGVDLPVKIARGAQILWLRYQSRGARGLRACRGLLASIDTE